MTRILLTEKSLLCVQFLVGKDGTVAGRYSPQTSPLAISADIEKALDA